MKRGRTIWLAAIVLVGAAIAVSVLLVTRSSDEPYVLAAWDYGGIAWVEPAAMSFEEVAGTATELADGVFELWGLATPNAIEDVRIARKAGLHDGGSLDLYALGWMEAVTPPVIVVVFPDRESSMAASGSESASFATTYAADLVSAAPWLTELIGASVAILCTADRWQEQLVSEMAEWMVGLWMSEQCRCTFGEARLPELVVKGFVAHTAGSLIGREGSAEAVTITRAWMEENEIPVQNEGRELVLNAEPDVLSALGQTFVAYLLEDRGTDELLDVLCAWQGFTMYCAPSRAQTLRWIDGWRTSLGFEDG